MNIDRLRKALFVILLGLCATPWVDTALALVMGILLSLLLGNPWPQKSAHYSKKLLQISVVGLGFGLSLGEVVQTGKDSIWYSVVGIACTLLAGYLLGRLLRTDRNTSALISFGTAIYGGSAIAALAPVLKAKNDETAVALAVGTTVKLTRAVWIAPVVMIVALCSGSRQKTGIPLFIVGFAAAAIRTVLLGFEHYWGMLAAVAKQCLVVTLFMVGAGLSREVLKKVGAKPLLQGIILWLLVSGLTLVALNSLGLV